MLGECPLTALRNSSRPVSCCWSQRGNRGLRGFAVCPRGTAWPEAVTSELSVFDHHPLPPHTPTGQCHSVTKEGNVLCRPRVLPGIVSGRRGQERRPSHPTQIAFGWSHKPGALAPWIGEEALECFICPSSCAEMIETQKARSWESSHGCSSVYLTSRMLKFP